jgi:hypothetical protein
MFYRHAQECLRRLGRDAVCGRERIEAVADHIAAFSLAGIGPARNGKRGKP